MSSEDIQNKYQLPDQKWRVHDVIARVGEIAPSDSEVFSELTIERPTLYGQLNTLKKEDRAFIVGFSG